MKKVDVPQVLISSAAIFGLGLLWYDFNVKIFVTVRDLMKATLFDSEVNPTPPVSETKLLPTEETEN